MQASVHRPMGAALTAWSIKDRAINDPHNHAYGDAVLKFMGQSLVHPTRPGTDSCVRYAGDALIVLLSDTPISVAVQVAERLQATLKTYVTDDSPAKTLFPWRGTRGEYTYQQIALLCFGAKSAIALHVLDAHERSARI